MHIGTWYIPSSSGDFRLEDAPATTVREQVGETNKLYSLLTVENPTPREIDQLTKFLQICRSKNWIQGLEGISATGRSQLLIKSPVSECGIELASTTMPSRGTLTVIKSSDGHIVATTDDTKTLAETLTTVDTDLVPDPSIRTWDAPGRGRKKCLNCNKYVGSSRKKCACGMSFEEKPKPTELKGATATTVKRGTTCCPNPIEGPLKRSSRVLREFCTRKQWKDWVKKGHLICFGGSTGYAYRLAHRHHPLAAKQGKICWDIDHGCCIKFWDWSIPAAEEVLSAKLILEHREAWLRNSSTTFGAYGSIIFTNPLGSEVLDGTWDASLFNGIGSMTTTDVDLSVAMGAGLGVLLGTMNS